MIQPIGAFSPRADLRGHGVAFEKKSLEKSKAQVAWINSVSASAFIAALITAFIRGHTNSWANAVMIGAFAFLGSLSFLAPLLVKDTLLARSGKHDLGTLSKESTTHVVPKIKRPQRLVLFG